MIKYARTLPLILQVPGLASRRGASFEVMSYHTGRLCVQLWIVASR